MCEHCEHRSTCQNPCPAVAAALDAVTGQPNGREVLVSLDDLEYLWTTNSRLSLSCLQGANVRPPLYLVFDYLTEREKKIFVWRFVFKRTERQIAKRLKVHYSAVHQAVQRGRRKVLKFLLEQERNTDFTSANYEG